MIALKKIYGDDLLRLALVLSLLKSDPSNYLERETQQLAAGLHISNGSDWSLEHEARTLIRPRYVHPKSLDNVLINYERELFEELNTLGRYGNYLEYNDRMQSNRPIHTYLVNNVSTDTVAPGLAEASGEEPGQDGVSADDNVGQEVKVEISDEDSLSETQNDETTQPPTQSLPPDAVVTLSADFFSNHSESDIFQEISTRSFDVNELLVQPNEMHIKKEPEDAAQAQILEVNIKKERENEDLYSDNAMDDFVDYFHLQSDKMELGDQDSVLHQNLADLQEYEELLDDVKHFSDFEYLDSKHQPQDLDQYLLENTPIDTEVYELAPMFEEELVLDVKRERASTSFTSASSSGVSDMDASSVKEMSDVKTEPDEGHHTGDELTQEDMDLIEVLWKQDVDMGFSIEDPVTPEGPQATKVLGEEIEKELKLAEEKIQKKKHEEAGIEKVKASLLESEIKEDDPWAGLSYTVDTETGEYVLQGELPRELVGAEESRFDLLEEALQLVELGDEPEPKDEPAEAVEGSSSGGGGEMLHPAMRHVPHHPLAHHYHNQSLMRSMSVEQRWQDLASLLTIPPPPDQYQHYHPHHQHPHNISAHGAAGGYPGNYHAPHAPLPAPVPEKHPDAYPGAAAPLEGAYKVESAHHPQQHDGLYYQNSTGEMGPPNNQDGFLQSILNDEDLQLMDMAMNEGMYTMRMLDGATGHHGLTHNHTHMMMQAERDSASDSAVSSMGSERVPSLSDGEWCDGNDSAQEFHSSKFRPYESAYGRERSASHAPQKKHHMFGKRCFQEQPTPPTLEPPAPVIPPAVKYERPDNAYHHDMHPMHNDYAGSRHQLAPPHASSQQPALDLNIAHSSHALLQSTVPSPSPAPNPFAYAPPERVRHNHTYSAPLSAAEQRPAAVRDKRVRRLTDGSMSDSGSTTSGHLSRDEKRAKALGIPMEVHDIINLPMDEFNERLSKHDLSEAQLSLIRDIRRRGKNKVAAQNCRKRKLDQIVSLADEVKTVRDRKIRTQREHHSLHAERQRVKERFAALYRHVFQNLRDPDGRPLSSSQYSLQQSADGNVVLVPKMQQHQDHPMNRSSEDEMDRKAKHYEQ